MIGVDKIEDIRKRGRAGESIAAISRATGVSEPTVRKYLRATDLSPEPPRRRESESELLAPYAATIDAWLDDDCRCESRPGRERKLSSAALALGLYAKAGGRESPSTGI